MRLGHHAYSEGQTMLPFYRRIGTPRRKPRVRSVGSTVRLHPEQLESRELLTIPLPPTGVLAKGISASAIALSWNASTDPTVTGYNVYEKVFTGGGRGAHWVNKLIASNLTTNSDTTTGITGFHTFVVT